MAVMKQVILKETDSVHLRDFKRSTLAQYRVQTLDQLFRHPLGPSLEWGVWWLSEFCTQSLSFPTFH